MQHIVSLRHLLTALVSCGLISFSSLGSAQDIEPMSIGQPVAPAVVNLVSPNPVKVAHLPATVVVPDTSRADGSDLGKKAHTNVRFISPAFSSPLEAPPYSGYAYETPTSLACVYHLVGTLGAGCNPNTVTVVNSGGSQKIAIVDAYDDPEAAPDLAYFSAQFGLPFSVAQFQVIYAGGAQPSIDYTGGWELEESLDIEMAHAMAPNATIYLVEAQSNAFSDLFTAVTEATNIIQCNNFSTTPGACATVTGKGEISMSWGGDEFSGETAYDAFFNQSKVVFFASSGDAPGPMYPAASPNVISVGGTSIGRNPNNGNYLREDAWSDAGSGPSAFEKIPSYQSAIAAVKAVAGTQRATPDVAAVANPYTGVWVYDSMPTDFYFYPSSWWIVGGTSAAAPLWAGIVNKAGSFAASSTAELTTLYAGLGSANFKDISYGDCYFYMGTRAVVGYDLCTGIGSPLGTAGK